MIATESSAMKKECLSKKSCGFCESKSRCFSGDDIGPHDPDESCKNEGWAFTVTSDVAPHSELQPGDVSGGIAAFLSFFWLFFGLGFGLIVGPVVTLSVFLGIYIFKTMKVETPQVVPEVKK
jgi:hypothetical protein